MKKLFALLLAMLLLTGCDGIANKDNIINLLSSPKLSRRESRIVECITNYLGHDIILKYPKQGSNVSPVQLVDLSGDGSEEAVVLYTAPSTGGNVRIAVLSQNENGWQVNYDGEGYGSEIYKIVFAELHRDSHKQIIVGYTFSDSSEKILSVYFTDNGRVKDVQSLSCQDFAVQDVTGDNISDIVLAGVNADNQRTQVRVLSMENSTVLTALATRGITVSNAKVTNIAFSRNDFSEKSAIVVDYTDVYYRVYTQRMYFENYGLHTILSPDAVQKRWVYDYSLDSMDVDGDGYLETPTIINPELPIPENLKFMEWTCFLSREPVRKFYGVCEAQSGIYFPLPDSWQNLVTLTYGEKENTWNISRISDGALIMEFELLSAGYEQQPGENRVIVSAGTLQIKITADPAVSEDQMEYIAEGLMYIK